MSHQMSRDTALAISYAHREIELLEDIRKAMTDRRAPDIRDAFGRQARGLQLGVPSGENGHRLFHVEWSLAEPIIEAHIAQQRAKLAALNAKARAELDGLGAAP